jgi:hypothetical protein
MILEEEDAFLAKATQGLDMLRALQAAEEFMDPGDPDWSERLTERQWKAVRMINEAMKHDA